MRIQKFLRLLLLFFFIMISATVPFPLKFYRKDNLPSYEIEQVDQKEEQQEEKEEYQAFS